MLSTISPSAREMFRVRSEDHPQTSVKLIPRVQHSDEEENEWSSDENVQLEEFSFYYSWCARPVYVLFSIFRQESSLK